MQQSPAQISLDLAQDQILFLDFDHTLLAANSTELFIASCRPMIASAIIDFLVRSCIPWRALFRNQSHRFRDYACCVLLVILLPWNLISWRRKAADTFNTYVSCDVLKTISRIRPNKIIIISFGFSFLIAPLLKDTAYGSCELIAGRFMPRRRQLKAGKKEMALVRFSETQISSSVFITDSLDDEDLLNLCRSGYWIQRQGDPVPASTRLYLPLRYTLSAKYRAAYFLDQLVFVDLFIVYMSTKFYKGLSEWHHLTACAALLLSVYCIYEIGYFENDMIAAKSEVKPVLTDKVPQFASYPCYRYAWVWAVIFYTIAMISVLSASQQWTNWQFTCGETLYWIGGLLCLRSIFYTYNRIALERRSLLYPFLQLGKYGLTLIVLAPSGVSILVITSQIIVMWVNYVVYRARGSISRSFLDYMRLALFLVVGVISLPQFEGGPISDYYQRTNATLDFADPFLVLLAWATLRLAKPNIKILSKKIWTAAKGLVEKVRR